eukprot:GFYU01022270.1.p1 GENE.GFYU01022270.1~~GFYU01022270.1.p1  ORF type:complete len:162 (+),score=17.07 GFYU01022270.1:92-577(+)
MTNLSSEDIKHYKDRAAKLPPCAKCGSKDNLIPTSFGKPTGKGIEAGKQGYVKLMGCRVDPSVKVIGWCNTCECTLQEQRSEQTVRTVQVKAEYQQFVDDAKKLPPCGKCGTNEHAIPGIFGKPAPILCDAEEAGLVRLMGCMMDPTVVGWCKRCETEVKG